MQKGEKLAGCLVVRYIVYVHRQVVFFLKVRVIPTKMVNF